MVIDWTATWGVIGPALAGLGTWIATRKPSKARVEAAVAQAKADTAVADAEGSIYTRLRAEMDAMQASITRLRTEQEETHKKLEQTRRELDDERDHRRKQDSYIWLLIKMLRERGDEPPPFDSEPIRAGGTI